MIKILPPYFYVKNGELQKGFYAHTPLETAKEYVEEVMTENDEYFFAEKIDVWIPNSEPIFSYNSLELIKEMGGSNCL